MSLNFTNTGFLSFNNKYNKKNTDGSFTCSMTLSDKDNKGEYTTSYINAYIPASISVKYNELIRKALGSNKGSGVLLDFEGIIKINEKRYPEAVIFKLFEHKAKESGRIYSDKNTTEFNKSLPF